MDLQLTVSSNTCLSEMKPSPCGREGSCLLEKRRRLCIFCNTRSSIGPCFACTRASALFT